MDRFAEYILRIRNLNPQQINLITSKAIEIELSENEFFSEAGKVPKQVGFILKGVLRVCYYTKEGEEVTKYFIDEDHFIVDYQHFEANLPATEYVQAVTDCTLLVFSKENWDELLNSIVEWESIVHKIVQNALAKKLDRRSPLVSQDATTRYLAFLEKFPTIANRVPLAYIASYLGITQSSLSRIRKNIS